MRNDKIIRMKKRATFFALFSMICAITVLFISKSEGYILGMIVFIMMDALLIYVIWTKNLFK